jgi:HSP20 family protein
MSETSAAKITPGQETPAQSSQTGSGQASKLSQGTRQTSSGAFQTQATPGQSSVKLVAPEQLADRMNRIRESVARRAYEIFENDGLFGRDLENWLAAEAELLQPLQVNISESGDALVAQAQVPGFSPEDLEVSLEPGRLTITGKKESRSEQNKEKDGYQEYSSKELFQSVDLPEEVDASKSTATLKNGTLILQMPKASETSRARVQVRGA